MNRAKDQLPEEQTFPHLAEFLRAGGKLEVGENFLHGAFASIQKHNKTVVVNTLYRDFDALLKEMDSKARQYMDEISE